MLQDLLKLEKLTYNTKNGKESTELNQKKYVMLTVLNKITLY